MGPNWLIILNVTLYLSDVWLGVDLRTCIKKICVQKIIGLSAQHLLIYFKPSTCSLNKCNKIITLTMNEIYIRTPIVIRQMLAMSIIGSNFNIVIY